MDAPKSVTTQQPKGAQMELTVQPSIDSPKPGAQGKALHLRGGGAAKDCFLSAVDCFICFECCRGICDCVGSIICCPCEMCC